MRKVLIGMLLGIIINSSLGCSIDRWAEVEPGGYMAIHVHSESTGLGINEIEKLLVYRGTNTATIKMYDGSPIVVKFGPREKQDWPTGCPSNIGSTRMEILDIENDNLSIGEMTFNNPILVRNCPPAP